MSPHRSKRFSATFADALNRVGNAHTCLEELQNMFQQNFDDLDDSERQDSEGQDTPAAASLLHGIEEVGELCMLLDDILARLEDLANRQPTAQTRFHPTPGDKP